MWCLSRGLKEIKEQLHRYGGKNVPGRAKSWYKGPVAAVAPPKVSRRLEWQKPSEAPAVLVRGGGGQSPR